MEDRKTYTFPTDVFYKLQDFLSERILHEMDAENPDDEEIDELNNMQYYLAEFHKEGSDDDSIEIELDHDCIEFLFNRLLISALYLKDWKQLYNKLDSLYLRLEKICDRAISNYKELEALLNQQSSLITEQSEFIDFLMDIDTEEKDS